MTSFAAIVALDGARVTRSDLAPLSAGLGVPAARLCFDSPRESVAIALVDQEGSTTGIGPFTALVRASDGSHLLLDGRLDDRVRLAGRARFSTDEARSLSDAAILAAALAAKGLTVLEAVVGPFALLHVAPGDRRVVLARDPLGERTLFFRRHANLLGVASRPSALLALGGRPVEPDEGSIARFLALHGPRRGSTYFRGIEEVQAGAFVQFDEARRTDGRAVDLVPSSPPGKGRERDFEECFRELLAEAVRSRLPVGADAPVLMSGGLDSTAVAATVAAQLEAEGRGPVTTISWTLPGLPESDESPWIEATNRYLGANAVTFNGNELSPLSEPAGFQQLLDAPVSEIYWPVFERALMLTKDRGFTSLLTGSAADFLWGGGRSWLRDLLRSGRLMAAAGGVARGAGYAVTRRSIAHPLWNSLGPLVRPDPWRPREPRERPWLTPVGQRLHLNEGELHDGERPWDELRVRTEKILSPRGLDLMANSDRALAALGLEMHRPYRDKRLVEFFLSLPGSAQYRPGQTKRLLRHAFVGRLPEGVLGRTQMTTLDPLVRRGFGGPAWRTIRETLCDEEAAWPRFVDAEWLWNRAATNRILESGSVERMVLWQCFSLERWCRSLTARHDLAVGELDRSEADGASP